MSFLLALTASEKPVQVSTCSGCGHSGQAGAPSQAGALGRAGHGPLPLLSGGWSGALPADPTQQRTAGRSAQRGPSRVSFFPRAKVIQAPRCRLSDPTCWPSSLTSPAGPRCTSVSASCWARTGSRGARACPTPPPPGGPGGGGQRRGASGHPIRAPHPAWLPWVPGALLARPSLHWHPGRGLCGGSYHPGDTEPPHSPVQVSLPQESPGADAQQMEHPLLGRCPWLLSTPYAGVPGAGGWAGP